MRTVAALVVAIAGLFLARAEGPLNERIDVRMGQREVLRLEAHFDSVIGELRAARVDHLNPSQRVARSELIAWLHQYRDAGRFPRNDGFAVAMPYFRDAGGTLCAMAYLVARSGRTDIVDRVAQTANNALIHDLQEDGELTHWLDSTGFSVAEAARVQPSYGFGSEPSIKYGLATAVASGAALVSTGFNVLAPSRASGWFGVITGTSAAVLGLANLSSEGADGTWARRNVAIGVGTIALSVRGFTHKSSPGSVAAAVGSQVDRRPEVAVTPIVMPGRQGAALGIGVRATF